MSSPTIPVLSRRDELLTAADLEELRTSDARYELVEGRPREMPPAGGEHGFVTKRLDAVLTAYVYEHNLGECALPETGFLIARNPDVVLAPDWALVRSGRLPSPILRKFVELAPDLVLEARSPRDSARWIEEKTERWLQSGVVVVLNFDPGRGVVSVHRAGRMPEHFGPDDVLELDELPGLRVPLRTTLRW